MFVLLLLVPLALALVVLSVLGFAGFGPLTEDRRADRDGAVGILGPAVGLLLGIGLLGLAAIATVGVGLAEEEADSKETTVTSAAVAPSSTTTPTTAPAREPSVVSRRGSPLRGDPVLLFAEQDETFPAAYPVVDRLAPETVLSMQVRGFEEFDRGIVEQCAPTIATRCFNQIPVQFDEDGIARFQYLVSVAFVDGSPPPGQCRIGTAPCTIVVRSMGGEELAQIQTIFGAAAPPPGRITLTRADGLSLDGETVTVRVHDYPPGATVRAMLCAAPDATLARCGRPGPDARMVIGPDGTGSTELRIEPGPVGAAEASCTRGSDCGVTVFSRDVFARAPVVPISFAGRGGAAYDPTQLALGLALAAILLGIAAYLILRTDWSAVGEAAAPEIDDAEYADLDAIIAALPPEEEEEVLVTSR